MNDLPKLTDVLLERRQSALVVTLNRPHAKNAISAAILESLSQLADWLRERRDIRALVLRGAGGAFCAGGDIREFGAQIMIPDPVDGEADPVATNNRAFGELLLKMDALPQVLIAVVEGPCFGGASGFVSVADVVIAEEHARFSLAETTLGVPPAQIGPFLVRRTGLSIARRLALTGAHFGASEALRCGLIDKIVTGASGIESALLEVLNAVGRCEPNANAETKASLNKSAAIDANLLDDAAQIFANCLRNKGRDGAAAFAAKQAPPWVETFNTKKHI